VRGGKERRVTESERERDDIITNEVHNTWVLRMR
jgi:hypothetical protein